MAMGKRKSEQQQPLFVAATNLAQSAAHPFYAKLNEVLAGWKFDPFVEGLCAKFYDEKIGHPSLAPGKYFRLLLIGYFEGIDSERGIAWRCADSLSLRAFVGYALDEKSTEHSTISRTRRLIDVETHREVFQWVLKMRGELIERSFAHNYETGAMRRTHLRHHNNIAKRLLIHVGGFNLGLVMRRLIGIGKPRRLQGLFASIFGWMSSVWAVMTAAGDKPARGTIEKVILSSVRLAV